mmetsp:Transcript_61336/g.168383  ORF Transcript_61336/g.168383 Transcript_61336/m.168383 type:complete len:750 (+) Transcript_61336:558-2807(+)
MLASPSPSLARPPPSRSTPHDCRRVAFQAAAGKNDDCAENDCTDVGEDDAEEVDPFTADGGWALYFVLMLTSFWALAVVVEEYFVPALNVLCDKLNMPDDVAGATFMAAGASSPEMFAAFVSLFITHTSLGIGTIIGSEIFNHLCICAGSVLYSKSGELTLDPRILAREVIFYGLAIGGLLFSESYTEGKNGDNYDDKIGDDHRIFIHWWQALLLICGYLLYVVVCAYYKTIVKVCCPRPLELRRSSVNSGIQEGESEASEGVFNEPAANFNTNELARNELLRDSQLSVDAVQAASAHASLEAGVGGFQPTSIPMGGHPHPSAEIEKVVSTNRMSGPDVRSSEEERESANRERSGSRVSEAMMAVAPRAGMKLSAHLTIYEHDATSYSCYVWKKSKFYSKMRVSSQAWQLRWVTLDKDGFRSCRDKQHLNKNVRHFNIYQGTKVEVLDDTRLIFKLFTPTGNLQFQAPSQKIFHDVMRHIQAKIEIFSNLSHDERSNLYHERSKSNGSQLESNVLKISTKEDLLEATLLGDDDEKEDEDDEEHEDLMTCPSSCIGMIMHVLLFPCKCAIHFTIPDVRHHEWAHWYMTAIFMCIMHLACWSFLMSITVEKLAEWIGISQTVAGLTISAAGTSFPNILASMIVARQGMGNMAVGNAFGSNVFNVFMGLGLPWFLYCFFGDSDVHHDSHTYHGLDKEGVVFPTLVLLVLLIMFIILLWCTNMKLYRYHAYIFIMMYIGFLAWAIGWECAAPF